MPNNDLNLGLMPWIAIQCTLPHSRQTTPTGREQAHYTRRNGSVELVILANPRIGLPYGKIPRLLLAWTVREYRRRANGMPSEEARTIDLGRSYSEFLRHLGMVNNGGSRGSRTRLGNQAQRLFRATIQHDDLRAANSARPQWLNQAMTDSGRVWWNPSEPDLESLFPNYIRLSEGFAHACESAVPVDLNALISLRSPMQIDLLCWLSYRAGGLHEQRSRPVSISWNALMQQFGHGYSSKKDFKKAFRRHMRAVINIYPVRVESNPHGILVHPHPPMVARRHG